tara:strand:- start:1632 stop:2399 length:768 start_codon:yes stop_codon:yes gene_type:complete
MILLPHTIEHYRRNIPNAKIIILDNESTDKSVEIAKSLDCEIISWRSPRWEGMDEFKLSNLRRNCWKKINTGWIIVTDMDEWLCVTEKELENELNNNVSILNVVGINMVGESQQLNLSDIKLHCIKKYNLDPYRSRDKCFLREKINNINFNLGAHHAIPDGNIKYSTKIYFNKHMEMLGEKYYVNKHVKRTQRVQNQRKKHPKVCAHYTDDINCLKKTYRDNLEKAKIIGKNVKYKCYTSASSKSTRPWDAICII